MNTSGGSPRAECVAVLRPKKPAAANKSQEEQEFKTHYAHEKEIYMGLISSSSDSEEEADEQMSASVSQKRHNNSRKDSSKNNEQPTKSIEAGSKKQQGKQSAVRSRSDKRNKAQFEQFQQAAIKTHYQFTPF